MSLQQNIELHSSLVAAINARQVPGRLLAVDFLMEQHTSAATDYLYRGAPGWREWINDLLEEFAEDARCEVEEIVAAEEDFVLANIRVRGRAVHSGVPLEFRWAEVTWFRDGRATRVAGFTTDSEALLAVGMRRIGGRAGGIRRSERRAA